jgi:glutathione synthase/RimK-type ligase-like ATP-grasp enzyme
MVRPVWRPVLVLNGQGLGEHAAFAAELLAAGVEVIFRGIDEVAVDIGPGGARIRETVGGRDLADFGSVQVLSHPRPTATLLNALADYLVTRGIHTVNVAGIGAPTKLFKYVRLADRGLPLPSTVYLPPRLLVDSYPDLAAKLDLPFVLKTVTGGARGRTYVVTSEDAFVEKLRDERHARLCFLAQEFVPPGGSYFLLVMGGRVSLALRARGGKDADVLDRPDWQDATLVDPGGLETAVRDTAAQAAASLEYDIAGVRLVRHWTTGQWRVLDISPSPAISSGAYVADKVSAYSSYLRERLAHLDEVNAAAR